MKKKDKIRRKENLQRMLTDSEFTVKGKCVISLMLTKLDIINTFLLMKYNRTIIQMKTGRVKGYDSVCKKLSKKGLELDREIALEKINDLIGVRAICSYVDDIYRVADLLEKQKDIRIVKVKDYIKQPKKSGSESPYDFRRSYCFSTRNTVDSCRIATSYSCDGLLGQFRSSTQI